MNKTLGITLIQKAVNDLNCINGTEYTAEFHGDSYQMNGKSRVIIQTRSVKKMLEKIVQKIRVSTLTTAEGIAHKQNVLNSEDSI